MGDTAYSSVLFKEIGEQFRSFDFVMHWGPLYPTRAIKHRKVAPIL